MNELSNFTFPSFVYVIFAALILVVATAIVLLLISHLLKKPFTLKTFGTPLIAASLVLGALFAGLMFGANVKAGALDVTETSGVTCGYYNCELEAHYHLKEFYLGEEFGKMSIERKNPVSYIRRDREKIDSLSLCVLK